MRKSTMMPNNASAMTFNKQYKNSENTEIINLRDCFHKYMDSTYPIKSIDFHIFQTLQFEKKYPHFLYDFIHCLGGNLEFDKYSKSSNSKLMTKK